MLVHFSNDIFIIQDVNFPHLYHKSFLIFSLFFFQILEVITDTVLLPSNLFNFIISIELSL